MDLSAQHSLVGCGNCSSETLAADKKDDDAQRIALRVSLLSAIAARAGCNQPPPKQFNEEAKLLVAVKLYKLGRLSSPFPRYANISS